MKHLYGIIPTPKAMPFALNINGVHGASVHTVTSNGMTALVSDTALKDYSELYKPALAQLLAEHQQVTEQIMSHVPALLPIKFGTLLQTEEIQTLLIQAHADLSTALRTLTNKVEVELVVTWQPERVLAEIAQEPMIAHLRAEAANRTPEEVQQLQLVVGQLVKAGLDARRQSYQQLILDGLHKFTADVESNLILNDQIVANLAFLLAVDQQAEFDRQIEMLDAQLDGQLDFKIVGPLPAYSFSTVEVLRLHPDDIAWAQEILNLGDNATGEEIRAAYRKYARQYHPDVAGDTEEMKERFDEITEAYQLLQHCHAVQQQTVEPDTSAQQFRCDFSPATVNGTLLVNICRSSQLAN